MLDDGLHLVPLDFIYTYKNVPYVVSALSTDE